MHRWLAKCLENVRKRSPLILNVTNFVTANEVASAILACGANPIVSDNAEDIRDLILTCSGLNLNIGTVNEKVLEIMLFARKFANEMKIPVVLDPVGVGTSRFRFVAVEKIMNDFSVDVVCGNFSEIKAIGSGKKAGIGTAICSEDFVSEKNLEYWIEFVKETAKKWGSIIIASGKIDLISDGIFCYAIRNGVAEMAKVVGTGCQLSGVVASFLAANSKDDWLNAAVCAACFMGLAGEIGLKKIRNNFGKSLIYSGWILDSFDEICEETFKNGAKIEVF